MELTTGTIVDYEEDGRYVVDAANSPEPIRAIATGQTVTPGGGNEPSIMEPGSWVSIIVPDSYPGKPALILAGIPLSEVKVSSEGPNGVPAGNDFHPKVPKFKPARTEGKEEETFPQTHNGIPGQRGFEFSTGTSVLADYYMAELKAGEDAGMEVHMLDKLLTLTAMNFKQCTGGGFREYYTVGGEYSEIEMLSPYVSEIQKEPFLPNKFSDRPFPRHIKLRGYQGDLEREIIQTTGETDVGARLLDIHKGHDGRYDVRSAKSVTIKKTNLDKGPLTRKQLREELFGGQMNDYKGLKEKEDGSVEKLEGEATQEEGRHEYDAAGRTGSTITEDGSPVERLLEADSLITTDTSNSGTLTDASYSLEALGGRDLDQAEHEQRLLTLSESEALLNIGNDAPTPEDTDSTELTIDHRTNDDGDSVKYKLQKLLSILKVCNDGSIVLEAGESKIAMEDDSINIYSPNISMIGGKDHYDHGVQIGGGPIELTSSSDIHLAGKNIMNISDGKTVINNLSEGLFNLGAINGTKSELDVMIDNGNGWSVVTTLTKSFSEHTTINLTTELTPEEKKQLSNAIRSKVRWRTSDELDYLEADIVDNSGGGLLLEAREDMTQDYDDTDDTTKDNTTYTAEPFNSDGITGNEIDVIRPPGKRIEQGQMGVLALTSDGFKVFEPTHINPKTESSEKTIYKGISEGEEGDTDLWEIGNNRQSGLTIKVTTRVDYYHEGDQNLYGYERLLSFDRYGHLTSISDEMRTIIDDVEVVYL